MNLFPIIVLDERLSKVSLPVAIENGDNSKLFFSVLSAVFFLVSNGLM